MNRNTKIAAAVIALAALIPGGIFANRALERRGEIAEYVKACDAKAVEVNEALRDSLRAQQNFNGLAELILDDPSTAFTIVGQFVAAREARRVAAARDRREVEADARDLGRAGRHVRAPGRRVGGLLARARGRPRAARLGAA